MLAPYILSMSSYSLIYNQSHDFYIGLNRVLIGFVSMGIILVGLWFFPKMYYLSVWRKALKELMTQIQYYTEQMLTMPLASFPLIPDILIAKQYAQMLPKKMRYFSVVKITFLSFDILMQLAYFVTLPEKCSQYDLKLLHDFAGQFATAIQKKQPLLFTAEQTQAIDTSIIREMKTLTHSWNYLCNDSTFKKI
jgi:hypothetical protein